LITSKGLRNKIAGYVTHLAKRIKKGPVRGISLRIQEDENETKIEPKISDLIRTTDKIQVDSETKEFLLNISGCSHENLEILK
jgi:small subunit ribosomal protein S17e